MKAEERIQKVRNFFESQMEDTSLRDNVFSWCEKNQGKKLMKNNLPELPGENSRWFLRKEFGMTSIILYVLPEGKYTWDRKADFYLAHEDKNVFVPTPEFLKNSNLAYFSGIDERNEARKNFLADDEKIHKAAVVVDDILHTMEVCNGLREEFEELFSYRLQYAAERFFFGKNEIGKWEYDLENLQGEEK